VRSSGPIVLVMLAAGAAAAVAAEPVVPRAVFADARRVLVLGDSITHDGRWVAGLAAWLEAEGMTAAVVSCGLPSETISGLSEEGHAGGSFARPDLAERLDRVLRVVRPDLVLACYGMNCGIYRPLAEERFAPFRAGIERLHAAAEKAGAKIVHLTPPVYDARPGKPGPAGDADYDAVLAAYSDWLVSRRKDGWLVIDVHGPMRHRLDERRAREPGYVLAGDTVHPGAEGHWEICRAVLAGLGDERAATAADLPERLAPFLPDVTARLRILRDAYLAAAGHTRPGMPAGLPIADAEARARNLTASLRARRLRLLGRKHESGEWRMPIEWPRPKVVAPGAAPAAPVPPPADAVVLFDGTGLDAWENAGGWRVADGVLTVGKGTIRTKQPFGDCHLHVEFRTPTPAAGQGQDRGNSGVFLMDRYEIQVLDSCEDGSDGPRTYPDGQCGALYKQQPPAVNACRPPGEWQTFDILFTRPRFADDGTLAEPGRVSVLHNGIVIHADTPILGATTWFDPPRYEKHADALPVALQDHGSPVEYRGIWVRPIEPLVPTPLPAD